MERIVKENYYLDIAETVLESTARHGREMARRAGEQCAASAR